MESPVEKPSTQTFSTDEYDVLRCAEIYEELGGIKNIWEVQDALSKFSCTFTDMNSDEVREVFENVGYTGGELNLTAFIEVARSVKGILKRSTGQCNDLTEDEIIANIHTSEDISSICASFGLLNPSKSKHYLGSFTSPIPSGRFQRAISRTPSHFISGRLTPLDANDTSLVSCGSPKYSSNPAVPVIDDLVEFTCSEEDSVGSSECSAATPEATWLGQSTHSKRSEFITAVRAASILVKSDVNMATTPNEKLTSALDKIAIKKMFHKRQYNTLIKKPTKSCVWGSPRKDTKVQRKKRKPDIPTRGSPLTVVRRELNVSNPYALCNNYVQGRNADTSTKLADMSYSIDMNDATILARHLKNAHISRTLGRKVPLVWPPNKSYLEPKKPSEEKKVRKSMNSLMEGKKKRRRRAKAEPTPPTTASSMPTSVPLSITPPSSPPDKVPSSQFSRQMQKWLSSSLAEREGTPSSSSQQTDKPSRSRRIIPRSNLWAP